MKIAMITSEANPLCKSGGLADVVYSLSREFNKANKDSEAVIFLPLYQSIKNKNIENLTFLGSINVEMSWRKQYAGYFETHIDGIRYILVDNEYYFGRPDLYGYGDDIERFAFFSLATLDIMRIIGFKPNIVHVHDWQGGMIPTLLKEKFANDPFYKNTKSVLTIHNPAFKGMMDKYYLGNYYGLPDSLFEKGLVRFEGQVSTLKSAIVYSDMITTVSPTHRNELLTKELSHGLSGVLKLREDDFIGIVNGLDVVEFDPQKDPKIVKNYNARAFVKAKKENKADLLATFHVKDNKGPVFGLVSRLTWQKGIDIIFDNVRYMVERGASLIILGSGEKDLERKLQNIRDAYPDRVGIYIGYNDALAHKVYAGCDFFLMPSLFEPCGIGQIIAQRYGTLPIVRVTGGLADTVINYDKNNLDIANGYSFYDYNGLSLGDAISRSLETFYVDYKAHRQLIRNAMKLDRSWKKSTEEYVKVYRKAMKK